MHNGGENSFLWKLFFLFQAYSYSRGYLRAQALNRNDIMERYLRFKYI